MSAARAGFLEPVPPPRPGSVFRSFALRPDKSRTAATPGVAAYLAFVSYIASSQTLFGIDPWAFAHSGPSQLRRRLRHA